MTLVTGGAGFVGSHLINSMDASQVIALVRTGKVGSERRILSREVRTVWCDLRSPINDQTIEEIGPIDNIVHMGAETHVDRSITEPEDFVMSNFVGTFNLLEYAHKIELPGRFIQFSTDEVFGPAPQGVFYGEDDAQKAKNPYAATKAASEQLAWAWANTYDLNVSVVRSMNIFGEMQNAEKFIPLCIRKILKGERIFIHANKEKTKSGSRYYIHADDVARGVKTVLEHGENDKSYHCVGAEEISNLDLAKMIADQLERPLDYELVDFHSSRPGHDLRYALANENLQALDWTQSRDFANDLRATVRWYLNNPSWLVGGK